MTFEIEIQCAKRVIDEGKFKFCSEAMRVECC